MILMLANMIGRIAFLAVFFSHLLTTIRSYANEVNTQEASINNALTRLKVFTLITSFPLKDVDMQKRIGQSIEKTLNRIGEVAHLQDNDMSGFGSGNFLLIHMDSVTGWDGNELPTTRLFLNVETRVTLDKTGMKTFPAVWSMNTFLQGAIDRISEDDLTGAVHNLVNNFVQNYQNANKDQTKKPVFYTYD